MSTTARTVLSGVKTAIAAANGAGDYNYDLSGTDIVQIAAVPAEAMHGTRVYIMSPSLVSSPDGVCLGHYRRLMRCTVIGTTTEGTPEARLLAALDLLEDIARTLESDRTLGGVVYDLTIEQTTALDGEELHLTSAGVAAVTLLLTWSERGTGA